MLQVAFDQGARGVEQGPRFLFPLLIIALIVFVVTRIRRRRHGGMGHHHHGSSPAQTLADRFARGEIDQAEFDHRRAVLNKDKNIPPAPSGMAPPAPPTGSAPTGGSTMTMHPTDEVDSSAGAGLDDEDMS